VGFEISSCAQLLFQELRSGIIDLAFLLADSIQEHDLIVEVLNIEKLLLVAGPGHALAAMTAMQLKDLSGQVVLLPTQDCSYKMLFEQMLAEEKAAPGSTLTLNSIEAIKHCVSQGIGVTLIPEMAIQKELATGELVRLPWVEKELETAILMIRHKDKWIPSALQMFIDLVKENFAS
jgi:DNA-binding transcriptional LysR family regulator